MFNITIPSNPDIFFYGTPEYLTVFWKKIEKKNFFNEINYESVEIVIRDNKEFIILESIINRIRILLKCPNFHFINSEQHEIKIHNQEKLWRNTFYKKHPFQKNNFILLEEYSNTLNSEHMSEVFDLLPLLGVKKISIKSYGEYKITNKVDLNLIRIVNLGGETVNVLGNEYLINCEYGLPIEKLNFIQLGLNHPILNFIYENRLKFPLNKISITIQTMQQEDYNAFCRFIIPQKKYGFCAYQNRTFHSRFNFEIEFHDKNLLLKNGLI